MYCFGLMGLWWVYGFGQLTVARVRLFPSVSFKSKLGAVGERCAARGLSNRVDPKP